MDPRPYQPADLPACKALCSVLEVPTHFHVFEHNGEIIAFGGYNISTPTSAHIRYCTVHPDWRRQGIGRYLILYLLKQISTHENMEEAHAFSSIENFGFFEKQGFKQTTWSSNAWAIYTKKLTVCT